MSSQPGVCHTLSGEASAFSNSLRLLVALADSRHAVDKSSASSTLRIGFVGNRNLPYAGGESCTLMANAINFSEHPSTPKPEG